MKKILLLVFLFCCINGFSLGQEGANYSDIIKKAWGLYEKGEYLNSGQKYSEAFASLGGKGLIDDRYNAACSWALAGVKDSAFINLFKIANSGRYTDWEHLSKDSDLNSLYSDPRWDVVLEIVKGNKEKAEAGLDKTLVAILDTIHTEDQKYRLQIEEIEKKYGYESDEMKAHWKLITEKDSINLIKIKKILDEYGWLGADVIGPQGNTTLFLVIQHADLETQEKYLPLMRDAADKGKAHPANLALLEDRVALRQGKRQIYGSQIGRDMDTGEMYVLPLEDADNVDKRREAVGLGKLQDYVSRFGIIWDAEEYKKKLPEIEAKQKK